MVLLFFSGVWGSAQSAHVWQQPSIVTEKERPEELAYAVFVEPACPITEEELIDIVEGVLVRNRIKPRGGFSDVGKEMYLDVIVYCSHMHSIDKYAVNIQVRFAANLPPDAPFMYRNPYSRAGITAANYIESSAKALVEAAIADYRRIYFDPCQLAGKVDENPVYVCLFNSLLGAQRALATVAAECR
jgi:hypothetical protein